MSDGFQVTMTGLRQAAGVFRAEAGTFAAIMPSGGPASVDGGSAELNDALSLLLTALYQQIAPPGHKQDAALVQPGFQVAQVRFYRNQMDEPVLGHLRPPAASA